MKNFTLAQAQMRVPGTVKEALAAAEEYCRRAKDAGADMLCLPEMFCCPYETKNFPLFAEPDGGSMRQRAQELAAKYKLLLSAGSVPESDGEGRVYNTAYVFDADGNRLAKHRKMHLFNIDVKGGQRFFESETLTAGDSVTVFDTAYGKMGICICYDIRFPELTRLMALNGALLVLCPAAFNMTTGPLHWSLCHRSEAMYNQVFLAATSPCRDMSASYHAYGHTMAVDPFGNVIRELDENEGMLVTDIDFSLLTAAREQIPLLRQRRTDLYTLSQN